MKVGSTNGTVLEYPDGLILHLVPYEFVKVSVNSIVTCLCAHHDFQLLDECIIQFGKSVTAADGSALHARTKQATILICPDQHLLARSSSLPTF